MDKKAPHKSTKTKTQGLVFSVIMVIVMVYCMVVYNLTLKLGLSYSNFVYALRIMWPVVIAAFLMQRYVASPIAYKLLPQIVNAKTEKRLAVQVAMAGCMVFVMTPCMTLIVSVMHYGLTSELPLIWLRHVVFNFPFALLIQIFYVGPFVRLIYRMIFRKQF